MQIREQKVLSFFLGAAVIFTLFMLGARQQTIISAANVLQSPITFVIDAGHGGEDGGALSVTGRPESAFNLAISQDLEQFLVFCGWNTRMIREGDYAVYDPSATSVAEKKISDLKNRTALVNATPNAVLLSIHQNQFPEEKYHGAQVFYSRTPGSRALAERIQTEIRTNLDPANHREIKQSGKVYLMEHITCPGVLIECGFLSNREEEQKLSSPIYQKQMAMTIGSAAIAQQVEESITNET